MEEFKNHTFAICAYKESEYLEDCIQSLLNQKVKSNIIMATSTPNDLIKEMSEKYNIPLFINNGEKGIGNDWNFAVSSAKTKYVTVAHQDDIYENNFAEEMKKLTDKYNDVIIGFGNQTELRDGKKIKNNINLIIKRILLFPLFISNKSKFMKKLVISFGSPICCPSVMVNTEILGKKPYRTDMRCNIDWGSWLKFVDYKGRFAYTGKYVMSHRIHNSSETTAAIGDNIREKEDYEMFCRIWPKWFAKFLMIFYKNATKSNN